MATLGYFWEFSMLKPAIFCIPKNKEQGWDPTDSRQNFRGSTRGKKFQFPNLLTESKKFIHV